MDNRYRNRIIVGVAVVVCCFGLFFFTDQRKNQSMDQETEQSADQGPDQTTDETAASSVDPSTDQSAGIGFEERDVPVFQRQLTDRTIKLRFYEEMPNVAYMGIGDYFDLMLGGGLKVEEKGEGNYLLTNASGGVAEVDVSRGVVSSDDLPAFENYLDNAKEVERGSFKDSDAPYLSLREVVYLDEPERVEMDLESCGITLHGEEDEVYFPVSVLATWLADIAQNTVCYNGEYLYVCNQMTGFEQDTSYYNTEYYQGIVNGGMRESDLTAASYADLCFVFRYMYGYPGRGNLDTEILREKGFDEALMAYGEEGAKYREQLTSEDFRQFWLGMYHISHDLLDDGHNSTELTMDLGDPDSIERQNYFMEFIWDNLENETMSAFSGNLFKTSGQILEGRPAVLESEHYYKYGDTAIIYFNDFSVDRGGWLDYYENGGSFPQDTLGVVASGLKRASEDGEVRNILFDVSSNLGGFTDAVMGVISLMTGKEYLAGFNELSQQRFRIYFDMDRNLDGVFDEKDQDVHYDFNYAALISGGSFSCGNFFPFLVRESGGMLIGDRSGGGTCSVQKAILSEGFDLFISGYKFKLRVDDGSELEEGAVPDVQLQIGSKTEIDEFTGEERTTADYSAYGDLDELCRQVSEWYSQEEAARE